MTRLIPKCFIELISRASSVEKIEVKISDWEKQSAKTAKADMQSRAAQCFYGESTGGIACRGKFLRGRSGESGDGKLLQAVADTLKSKFNGPIFLAGAANGSVALVASILKQMTSTFQANKLIQLITRSRRRQRRRPTRKRARCRQRRKQDRRGAGKSARGFRLSRNHGALTDGKRPS